MKILVGSKNPAKIESVKSAFSEYFEDVETIGISVPSGVPDQPFEKDVLQGAKNRAQHLHSVKNEHPDADYFVGVEGGITDKEGTWMSFAASCIVDKSGKEGIGISHHFALPSELMEKIHAGQELGAVIDDVTREENTKQKGGAIGFLTKGVITRRKQCHDSVVLALVPFINKELWP